MKNRLDNRARRFGTLGALREILLPVLAFLLIGALFLFGINSVGKTTEEERLRSIEQAIVRATVQCYAVEGAYPPSLQYLEENYVLVIDHQKYIIQYDIFASNLMPTILVLPMHFEDDGGDFDDFGDFVDFEDFDAGGLFDEDGR